MKNGIKTSRKVAKLAGRKLRDSKSSSAMKSLAGTALINKEADTKKKSKRKK